MQKNYKNDINIFFEKLTNLLRNQDNKGYNPYDLLASPYLNKITNTNILLILTQFNKLSPINFRPFLKINKNINPKANALVLLASSFNSKLLCEEDVLKLINTLIVGKSGRYSGYTIGFPFPIILSHYKSKANEPSLIITLFIMYAFLSYGNFYDHNKLLPLVNSFYKLVVSTLPKKETEDILYYSYNFDKFNEVYNATAKIGKFFALYYDKTNDEHLIIKIKKILHYLYKKQRDDGSWPYAETMPYSDNYHTAFIIEAIYHMQKVVNKLEYQSMLNKALNNYYASFFKSNFQPVYYHPSYKPGFPKNLFPVTDIRDCAMSIIISKLFDKKEHLAGVLKWTINNMYDEKKGYFYFYKEHLWTNKINYIRAQAWMLYALTYIKKDHV